MHKIIEPTEKLQQLKDTEVYDAGLRLLVRMIVRSIDRSQQSKQGKTINEIDSLTEDANS